MRPELREKRMSERVLVAGKLVHPRAPHGTWGGYTNWFCRCDKCRATNTAGMRAYLAREVAS